MFYVLVDDNINIIIPTSIHKPLYMSSSNATRDRGTPKRARAPRPSTRARMETNGRLYTMGLHPPHAVRPLRTAHYIRWYSTPDYSFAPAKAFIHACTAGSLTHESGSAGLERASVLFMIKRSSGVVADAVKSISKIGINAQQKW